eukprot:64003-Alexandrium_andersonii.AAC.1
MPWRPCRWRRSFSAWSTTATQGGSATPEATWRPSEKSSAMGGARARGEPSGRSASGRAVTARSTTAPAAL